MGLYLTLSAQPAWTFSVSLTRSFSGLSARTSHPEQALSKCNMEMTAERPLLEHDKLTLYYLAQHVKREYESLMVRAEAGSPAHLDQPRVRGIPTASVN